MKSNLNYLILVSTVIIGIILITGCAGVTEKPVTKTTKTKTPVRESDKEPPPAPQATSSATISAATPAPETSETTTPLTPETTESPESPVVPGVQWVELTTSRGKVRALYFHPVPGQKLPAVIYNHGAFVEKYGYKSAAAQGYDVQDFVESIADAGYVGIAPIRQRTSDMEVVDATITFLKEQDDVDDKQIAMIGFSKGGIFTIKKAMEDPDALKGIVMLAGGYGRMGVPVTAGYLSDLNQISIPVYFALGKDDTTPELAENTNMVISELERLGKDVQYKLDYPGDHIWFRQVRDEYWNDVTEFLKEIFPQGHGKQVKPITEKKYPEENPKENPIKRIREEVKVDFIDSGYETASGNTSGWFRTGQAADIMLSGIDFNNAGGPLLFNHPGAIASDGKHLFLADTRNNRVLIWNKLPAGNVEPDLVLGQINFTSNNPGTGLDKLNWPVGLATDGRHLIIADTYNDRILIWNSIPSQNGQAADIVLSGMMGEKNQRGNIAWPWAVWTDGRKMVVTSTKSSQVLIWNTIPAQDNQPADIVLALEGVFGTPRTIGSDGKHLVIGDHNSFGKRAGNFFWRSFPNKDNQPYDFYMPNALVGQTGYQAGIGRVFWSPIFTDDGKLVVLTDFKIFIWDAFPEDENDEPDLVIGDSPSKKALYKFKSGDGSGMTVAGDKLYLSLSNGNKVVGFNSFPLRENQTPDFAVGAPDIYSNTLNENFIITNPVPVSNGRSLFVSSDFDRKLYVWKRLPDQSNAHPDIVYSLMDGPWDNALYEQTLVLAGARKVYVWKTLPLDGQLPDIVFEERIGSATFDSRGGVALDKKYFYLSAPRSGKIYVWEGIPDADTEPRFILSAAHPNRLSSDGRYLVVTCTSDGPEGGVKIFSLADISSSSQPREVKQRFNLPEGATASRGHLFVGDTGFNRVLIWKDIEDALYGEMADVVLGTTGEVLIPEQAKPQIGRNKLFWPAVISFDGSYLWVGEFKFSERLLRFSLQP